VKVPRVRLIAAVVVLAGLVLVSFLTRKTVIIALEGRPIELTTHAFKVSGALRDAGIEVGEKDFVYPPVDTKLTDGQAIVVRLASRVIINTYEGVSQIETAERIPANWLLEVGIQLNPADKVFISGRVHPPDQEVGYAPVYTVEVRPASEVTLWQGTESMVIHSAAPTLGQALWEGGITIHAADRLQPLPETPFDSPMTATLLRARPVEISVDGQVLIALAGADTVGEALAEVGISLQGLDYSHPSEEQPIPLDGKIRVVRVTEEVVLEQEMIPFWTEYQLVEDLEIDQVRVVQFGEYGLQVKRVRIRYEDRVEVDRTVDDEWRAREPKPRIEGYGTKIVWRTVNTPDGPIEYWRVLNLFATSYSPCRSDTPDGSCAYSTAGKLPVQKGVAAVRYKWWFYMNDSHWVYVPGYGSAVISDVGGGAPPGNFYWIDLGYSDDDYVPWAQWVTVYFTRPFPPPQDILYILPTN